MFLIFAEVLWPILTPLAVLLLERDPRRRQILHVLAGGGAVLVTLLLVTLLGNPAIVAIHHNSLAYTTDINAPFRFWFWRELPYVLCTRGALLLSSHRMLRVLGVLVIVGFAISAYAYYATFTSVWCFFAAAASTLLYFFFKRARAPALGRG